MFFIPGPVITALTFPGVIVHEMAHQLFCRLCNTAVLDVRYFRFGNPAGYVLHETPATTLQQVVIGTGPFLVNTLVGALISLPASIQVMQFDAGTPLDYLLMWLGISIAMHAFPSTGDAKTLRAAASGKDVGIGMKLLIYPIVGILYLGAAGSVVWLDALYGVGVTLALPKLMTMAFA
jgi:hypothetical protein